MQEKLFKFCNEKLGYTNRVGNALYGRASVYNASVFVATDYFNINISYFLDETEDEKLHALEDKLKFDPSIISLGGDGMATFTGIRIKLPLNDQSIAEMESIISDYVNYLKSVNIPAVKGKVRRADAISSAAEKIMQQNAIRPGTVERPITVDVKKIVPDPQPVVYNLKKPSELKKQAASQDFGLGSVLRGIAGSFLGASVFSLGHLISLALLLEDLIYGKDYELGFMFFIVTMLIPLGALLGYSRFKGDLRRAVKCPIIISVVAIITFISTVIGGALVSAPSATHPHELFDFALTSPYTIILLLFSLAINIGASLSYLRKDKNLV